MCIQSKESDIECSFHKLICPSSPHNCLYIEAIGFSPYLNCISMHWFTLMCSANAVANVHITFREVCK